MTQQEKLEQVLGDGDWHATKELVEQGHWLSATLHRAVDSFKFSVLSFEF